MDGEISQPHEDTGTAQHRRHLARGFNWLGGATIIAKIIDFSTIIVVLLYLTQQQLGIGSLAISIGMVIESFDGLGAGDALVQAARIDRRQLDSLFWFIIAAAVTVSGLTLAAAPVAARVWHMPAMTAYFIAIAAKQPIVGAAVIPLALLNRDLRYERIALINVGSTLATALARLCIALLGGGPWAVVGAFTASGVFILAGSLWAHPFLPAFRFSFQPIVPLIKFGFRSASAHIAEQVFKNIDYILVGWFYGPVSLALYRVIFDIAMEPAMAVGVLVNRTALPVFARAAANPAHLREALLWSLQRLATLVAPFMAALILMAAPLTALLHDSQGHDYTAGAVPLQILAGAAILRVASQLLTPVLLAAGRPGMAAWISGFTLAVLSGGIFAAGLTFKAQAGLVAVAAIWLAAYPPLLGWGAYYLRRHWHVRLIDLARPFLAPGAGIAVMALGAFAARFLPWGETPVLRIGAVSVLTACTYAALLARSRKLPAAAP